MKRTGFAKILAMCIMLVTVLGVLPLVMADDNYWNSDVQVNLTPNGYPTEFSPGPYVYFPGDDVEINLDVWFDTPDGEDDIFDIIVFPVGKNQFDDNVGFINDVELDAGGMASAVYDKTKILPDGQYIVEVRDKDWIQNSAIPWDPWDNVTFRVQMYTILLETDRNGYIPGDTVNVFYSVVSIKDGSLITEEGYPDWQLDEGEWAIWSEDGLTDEGPTDINQPSGTFDFKIGNTGSTHPSLYLISMWYNGTYEDDRKAEASLYGNDWGPPYDFRVDGLKITVTTDRSEYQLESVVRVIVTAVVNGTTVPEPDVQVEIQVKKGVGTSAEELDDYTAIFHTDDSGIIVYMFSLSEDAFEEDETYTVYVKGERGAKEDDDETYFDIRAGGRVISVNMVFDKDWYTSGETATITVETSVPAGASEVSSYFYEVTTDFGTRTMWLEASRGNVFIYDIPDNFEGTLFFNVKVYNPDSDEGEDSESKEIHHAVLLINAEPEDFEPGDVITANYELTSTVDIENERKFFYIVRDMNYNIVLEREVVSTASEGSFEYTVPTVASPMYRFYIYANLLLQVGSMDYKVWVNAQDICYLVSGYDIEISVDNPSYAPGDKVIIHYNIKAKGDEALPDKFVFDYGMSNSRSFTWQSDSPSGDIEYEIPIGVNEGDVNFFVFAYNGDRTETLGYATEILHIQDGASALEWTRALDVPLFSWILLLLIILAIIFMLFRRPAAAERAPAVAPPEQPAPVEEEMAPMAPEEASPLAINCKSCGAEIEITTSKRPIEVMCPSCGETEMVE